MPRGAVTMSIDVNEIPNTAAPAFSPDGSAVPAKLGTGPLFDPLAYGTAPPVGKIAHDRAYEIVLDDGFGFAQGSFTYVSSSMTATGSTWWTDSLNVAPGEIFEIDLAANNPGIWMDHCHNFEHGAELMIMHLAYTGIASPFDETHIPE
ncbi:multicopper oxidase domain-containing protein [Nonomuraea dietziae]|uniref:multicopper oxidase domain-containing protein n=1 Tax=Nonomuraea dietziae TaxID=65515 RepID=UPI0033E3F376